MLPTNSVAFDLLSLAPPATISSVPVYYFAIANEELGKNDIEEYYECCGKSICRECTDSFIKSGNLESVHFVKQRMQTNLTKKKLKKLKRMEANDARAICVLGCCYHQGVGELQHDDERAIELWKQAAKLGFGQAHYWLGEIYCLEGVDLKKTKVHYEATAMAGHKVSRLYVGRVVSRVRNELLRIGQLQHKVENIMHCQ